jgi:hypothetical protein
MSQESGTRDRGRGPDPTERPPLALLIVPRPGEPPVGPKLAATLAAAGSEARVLVAGADPESPLPERAEALGEPPAGGYLAFLHPGDEPDLGALSAAIAELEADEEADLLLGAVRSVNPRGGRVQPPPPDPVGAEQLLGDGCLAPGSVLVDAATPGLAEALEAFSSGAATAGMLGLLIGGRPRTSERVLATVDEDPAADWWTDDVTLAALAELAGSPRARARGVARRLRRELLSRLLNERPILGQAWRLPEFTAERQDSEQLRDLVDDLLWTLERQADSLLVLGGGWDDVPISPSPETGELFDLELVRRDDEITRLRATEQDLRGRLEDLHRRLTELRNARAADARVIAELRTGRRGAGRGAIRALRRILPARGQRGAGD